MSFSTPVDICNRGLQRVGAARISTLSDSSRNANECNFAYDKLRVAELEANVWRFSTRRAPLRKVTSTTKLITFGTWAVGTTYAAGDIVKYVDTSVTPNLTNVFVSMQGSNVGNIPSSATGAFWQIYYGPQTADTYSGSVTYFIGDLTLSSAVYYVSIIDSNTGNTPVSSATSWLPLTTVPTGVTLYRPYPSTQSTVSSLTTKNAFYLPTGFLRIAHQDAKQPGVSYYGTTGGMQFSDFEIEDNYIISQLADPIFFRFAADIVDVTRMSPMFCEGLGARIGYELCEMLTQSQAKQAACERAYNFFMAKARKINAVETGSTEPDEDAFNPSRLSDTAQQMAPGGGGRQGPGQ